MTFHFKKHKYYMFFIFLLTLSSVGCGVLLDNTSANITSLNNEIIKIDKQNVFFIQQNKDMLHTQKNIQDNIDKFLGLQQQLQNTSSNNLKDFFLNNPQSNELLSILPPSEIAIIQQNDQLKDIEKQILSLQSISKKFLQSIELIASQEFSHDYFSLGNISNYDLKTLLTTTISNFLKKENTLFHPLFIFDNNLEEFSQSTEKLSQIYPLLLKQQSQNKEIIYSNIHSIEKTLQILYVIFSFLLISLCCLILLFFKNLKKSSSVVSLSTEEQHSLDTSLQQDNSSPLYLVEEITFYEEIITFVNTLNTTFNKKIELSFDIAQFDSFSKEEQEKIVLILSEFIKFSFLYSFEHSIDGNIFISTMYNGNNPTLMFRDNGQGLDLLDLKSKIKQQYYVDDSIFIDKTSQQIYSFIFKPGFIFISSNNNVESSYFNMNLVVQLVNELSGQMSLSTHKNNGNEFTIQL